MSSKMRSNEMYTIDDETGYVCITPGVVGIEYYIHIINKPPTSHRTLL